MDEILKNLFKFGEAPKPTANVNKGLEAVNSIRDSYNLSKANPLEVQGTKIGAYATQIPTPKVPETALRPISLPDTSQREFTGIGKPLYTPFKQTISEVTQPKPQLYQPTKFKTTPLFQEPVVGPIAKFAVAKGAKPAGQATEDLFAAFNVGRKGEKLTGGERFLKGVSGVGTLLSIPNEVFIQPAWDTTKLAIKGIRTGQITQNDIDNAIYSFGGEQNTLSDALGLDEKSTNPVLYQAVRFIDFTPELIGVLPSAKATKFTKLERSVPIEKLPIEEEIDKAALAFEKQTGEKVSKETKDLVKNIKENPKVLFQEAQKVSESGVLERMSLAKKRKDMGMFVGGDYTGGIPPSGGIPKFLPEMGKVLPTKERRFPSVTVKKSASTAEGLKNIVNDTIYLYSPLKNKDEWAKAVARVESENVDEIINALKFADDPVEVSYVGQALMNKLQKEGNFARASDVLDIVAESATRSGQAIQALSVWGRLTPEGSLRKANDLIRKYNEENKLVEGAQGFLRLTDSKAKEITAQAKKVAQFGDGADEAYRKAVEISKLQRLIASVIPARFGEKLSATQTLAQLLNPKTFNRNIIGNSLFGSIDAVTQNFASVLDMAVSLFTKKRTVARFKLGRFLEGGIEGGKKAWQETLEGADTSQLASQFDLPNASVFDSKIMQGLEKLLNLSLRVPDRAFYEATYKDTLQGLMDLAKTDTPTKEMLEIAHYEGLRRTFQDDNVISKFFTSLKRSLNKIGIKGFGLGDLVLKYPKTPSNLLVRGLEYTPAGYLTAVIELARPLMGQTFDQRAFVNNLARATVGTGILNLGYALAKQGILTPRPDSDKDARASQDLQGIKSYAFNISALKRYVLSGFDNEAGKPRVGDQVFSYDWAQPAVFPLAMGANIAENDGKVKDGSFADKVMLSFGPLGAEIIQSSDTLTEQPLLQGIKTLFSTQNLQQGVLDTLVSSLSSFTPTILNQINQYTDNVSRETYSPNYFETAYNKFAARVPFLAQKLPARSDVLGRPKERFPNASNTFFNVFFNPAFVDTIKADPNLAEVISIYEQTGEKGQFPRIVDKSIQVNGERKLLSTQELVDYQRTLGQKTNDLLTNTITDPAYRDLPTTAKSKVIAGMISDANKVSKVELFGDNPEGLTDRTSNLYNGDTQTYVQQTLRNAEKSLTREELKKIGITKKPKFPKIAKAKKGRKPAIKKPKKIKLKLAKLPKLKKPKTIKLKAKV